MSPRIQKWALSALSGIISSILSSQLSKRFLEEVERPPSQRSPREDIKEAALEAGVAMVATIIASVLIRRLAKD